MGLPIDQKLLRQQLGHTLCNLYFSETAGCIYAIRSSMELSKPVVVQHHGHLTLTLGVVSRALQNNLVKIHNARNHIYGENFKLKFCVPKEYLAQDCSNFTIFMVIP